MRLSFFLQNFRFHILDLIEMKKKKKKVCLKSRDLLIRQKFDGLDSFQNFR